MVLLLWYMGHLWNDGSEDLSLRNDAMLGFTEMDIWYEQYWLWTLGCQVHGGVPKHAMFMWLVVAMTPQNPIYWDRPISSQNHFHYYEFV